MAEFVVNTDILRSEADSLESVQRELNAVAARLAGIQISNFLRTGGSSVALNRRISDCRNAVWNQASNLRKLSSGLDSVARLYDRTEQNLSEPKTQGNSSSSGSGSGGSVPEWAEDFFDRVVGPGILIPGMWPHLLVLNLASVLGSYAVDIHNGELPGEWSLFSGGINGSGSLWGIPCSGELGYSFLGYETDTIRKAKWNLEKGDAGIEYGGELSGHILKGEASGNIGILGGKADASLGNVGVSGKINATLFEDGKFTPSLGAEVKGEASALKGSAQGYLGNENYNAHANASGTLFGAEASAGAQIGAVTYKNKQGQTVTAYGVKGEVGAEAYVAEGKVSGGFTFMGIDIDIGVSGKAGGAGVEAGGSITTDGAHGEIGAGLGLGAGVEISVDWSDFDPPTWEEIGDSIQDVGENIGESIQDVGESIGDGLQAAGDFVQDTGEAIGEGIRNAGEAIGGGLRDAGEAIGDGLRNAGDAVSDFFNW